MEKPFPASSRISATNYPICGKRLIRLSTAAGDVNIETAIQIGVDRSSRTLGCFPFAKFESKLPASACDRRSARYKVIFPRIGEVP